MSFDENFEIPAPPPKAKLKGYDKPTSSNRNVSWNGNSGSANYDTPHKGNKRRSKSPSLDPAEPAGSSKIYEILPTSPTQKERGRGRTGGYDIPKDTINENIFKNAEHCPASPSSSPTKQPLLPAPSAPRSIQRSPPPTIVLSPPEDHSPEKEKVIFKYDENKRKMKLGDDERRPNFILRNKKPILITAFVILIFLLFSILIMVAYALNSK